eukprot:6466186-Amphidinium_carterae.1
MAQANLTSVKWLQGISELPHTKTTHTETAKIVGSGPEWCRPHWFPQLKWQLWQRQRTLQQLRWGLSYTQKDKEAKTESWRQGPRQNT